MIESNEGSGPRNSNVDPKHRNSQGIPCPSTAESCINGTGEISFFYEPEFGIIAGAATLMLRDGDDGLEEDTDASETLAEGTVILPEPKDSHQAC